MSPEVATLVLFGLLILFLFLGLPLAFTLGGVAMIAVIILWGPSGFALAYSNMFSAMSGFSLIGVPLFIFMAMLLERAGVAEDLYTMFHRWMGGLKGGLAAATTVICTIFAAMSGVSGAACATMGTIALPEMLKRNYDKKIAIGCIASAGALAILIPPSVVMILYGMVSGTSIGRLFLGGVFPGLLLSFLTVLYVLIRCGFQEELGPPLPLEERASWRLKFISLKAVALPILIVIMVLGSIFFGLTTVTEAAAMGVAGAFISSLVYRRFNWTMLKESCYRTAGITGMIVWILAGSYSFTALYTFSGASRVMEGALLALPLGRYGVLLLMMFIFLLLGMFLSPMGIILICTPVFLPVVESLGFDPLWFGILFVVSMEVGFMTPPFGFNLFYMRAVAPPDVTMGEIYKSIVPFVLVDVTGLFIIMAFPQIALWLPRLVFG